MSSIPPLRASALGLVAALAAAGALAWMVADSGHDLREVALSILTSTYPEELIPRLALAALFVLGMHLIITGNMRLHALAIPSACALIGLTAGGFVVIRSEIEFARLWAPGVARGAVLPVNYLAALVQVSLGFAASTILLATRRFEKRTHA